MDDDATGKVEIAVVNLTRTRAHEKIKIQLEDAEVEGTTFVKLFTRKAVDTDASLLSYKQLLVLYVLLQIPLNQQYWYIKMARESGGMNAFISLVIATLFVHFPLFLLYTTLGYYSKKGYIKLWECLPIYQGLSYITVIVTVLMEVNNMTAAGLTILYIYESFHGYPWKNCKFEGATENCIPHYPQFTVPRNNCEFASNQYNKYIVRNIFHGVKKPKWNNIGSIKVDWAVAVWFCCFVVCILSVIGFKKCIPYLSKLAVLALFGLCIPLYFITIMHSLLYGEEIYSMFKGYRRFLSGKLWVQQILVNMPSNSPGVLVYLSSVSPENMKHPMTIAFKVFLWKIVCCTLFMVWYAHMANQMLTMHNVRNALCLRKLKYPLPFIWVNIHHLTLLILCIPTSVIAVTATVNSICQAVPSLNKYRFRVCGLICTVIGCVSMLLTTQGARAYEKAIKRGFSFVFLVINVFALFGLLFVYGVKTLKHDFHFIYGHSVTRVFWFSITFLPIILTFVVVYIARNFITLLNFLFGKVSMVFNGVIICGTLSIFLIYQIVKNALSRHPEALLAPRKTWGVERKLRKARQAFNPDKEVEHNCLKLKCNHYCLVNSTRFKREIFTQTMLYESLIKRAEERSMRRRKTNEDIDMFASSQERFLTEVKSPM